MKKAQPTISVLMSVYNGEKYLATAIDSILAQTYQDFEFIIINDASTDSSEQIVKSYQDSRIIYLKNQTNLGLTKSLNFGIAQARGKYIARMDADDISLPERLAKQLTLMEEKPEVSVCGSFAQIINENGQNVGEIIHPTDPAEINVRLHFYNCLAHPTVIIRREILNQVNNYDDNYHRSQDFNLWHKIILNQGSFFNISEKLIKYRQHKENISLQTFQEQCLDANKSLVFLYQELLGKNFSKEINIMRRLLMTDNKKITFFDNFYLQKLYQQLFFLFKHNYQDQGAKLFLEIYQQQSQTINSNNNFIIKLHNRFFQPKERISENITN